MNKIIKNQIKLVEKKETKFLNKPENHLIKTKMAPIIDKIEEKIPDKLRNTLDMAFYKGFQLVFEKGTRYIEAVYNKDKKKLEHEVNDYILTRVPSKKHLKSFDKQADRSRWINSAISTVEGAALGILGVGLPDIPLFISMIMKTVYEIAVSYGYDYESESEKAYILLVICTAMTSGEEQKGYYRQLEELEAILDTDGMDKYPLEELTKTAARTLADALVMAKFIQGMPVIGIVGGVVNQTIINKIGKFAGIKYKKRHLRKRLKG